MGWLGAWEGYNDMEIQLMRITGEEEALACQPALISGPETTTMPGWTSVPPTWATSAPKK
jgi:hypothetical protein